MSGIMFTIKPGYLGDCGMCLRAPAKHKVYCAFAAPIKSTAPGLKDVEGVWQYVCDACLEKRNAKA